MTPQTGSYCAIVTGFVVSALVFHSTASARGIAHAYSVFATGGRELGLRRDTLNMLSAPAVPPARGFYDEYMKTDGIEFSLGFMKSTAVWPFGGARSFGSPGASGSFGLADPAAGVGYAYVTSQMGTSLTGGPRDVALRTAFDGQSGGVRESLQMFERLLRHDALQPHRASSPASTGVVHIPS